MILEVSSAAAETVSEDVAEMPEDDWNCDELDSASSRLELSGAKTELEEFATIHDELDSSSTEALLPSSPQATNPAVTTAKMTNNVKRFIPSSPISYEYK